MSTVVGGKRLRYIKDSLYYMLRDSLTDLDWLTTQPTRKDVTLLAEQIEIGKEIKPNVVAISTEDLFGKSMELGSNGQINTWNLFVDIFAESESLGVHLAGDILDILRGKFASIGRQFPTLEVSDPNGTVLFNCPIDNVELNRVREWDKPFNRYWWVIGFELRDAYYDDGE
jgi:hypothetical protein